MPLYTKPPLFGDGSSGLVYSGMLQNIRGLEHAPLSETYQKLDELTDSSHHYELLTWGFQIEYSIRIKENSRNTFSQFLTCIDSI